MVDEAWLWSMQPVSNKETAHMCGAELDESIPAKDQLPEMPVLDVPAMAAAPAKHASSEWDYICEPNQTGNPGAALR